MCSSHILSDCCVNIMKPIHEISVLTVRTLSCVCQAIRCQIVRKVCRPAAYMLDSLISLWEVFPFAVFHLRSCRKRLLHLWFYPIVAFRCRRFDLDCFMWPTCLKSHSNQPHQQLAATWSSLFSLKGWLLMCHLQTEWALHFWFIYSICAQGVLQSYG